jgi:hypothetical protein
MNRKIRSFGLILILFLFSLLICFILYLIAKTQVVKSRPRIVPPQKVTGIIRAIPSYTSFDYSGLCFFQKKLYASSNIGLLEFDGGNLSRLYKWYDRDDVISGPWLDVANKSVWVKHEGINKMIHYDGTTWEMTQLPQPKDGYTRGDILSGFRGTGTTEGFWLEGGGHAWRWNSKNSIWEPVSMPQDGSLARIIPLPNKILLVMRHELLPSFLFIRSDFKSDTLHYYEGQWKDVPNKTGINFFIEGVAIVKDVAYGRTSNGLVLRITPSEITKLESPSNCEAIATTTSGTLLASFRGSGIYEYTDEWHKKFSSPYSSTEAEHWAYIAESDGQVAFAITSMPHLYGEKVKYLGQTTLWVSEGNELRNVPLGER